MELNMDYIGNGGSQGAVANYMSQEGSMDPGLLRPYIVTQGKNKGKMFVTVYVGNGADPKSPTSYRTMPVTNATLRKDEWKQMDDTIQEISRIRLNGVQDLIDNGLTFNLGNAMGTTVLEYEEISDAFKAELTMDGVTKSKSDRPDYTIKFLPIPIIHVDFEINSRVLASSRTRGNPLDTTSVELATRKVSEGLEDLLFTDTTYAFGGGTIYSYLNHPDRNTVSLTVDWDASAKTPREILNDVLALKQSSIDAKHFGPWMLYIPTAYETVLDDDYEDTGNTSTNKTIRQRILEIANIKGIKVVDTLTANNVLLVQMTKDVVRLVRGMSTQVVHWETQGKFINKYKVMTIQVPQIRSDQAGNSGIVHLS